ncbi:MAG: ABC transporter permease [Treponema sp.]|jgi:ribose/xylose/arabinose/galactoside ABC-type transport system permease subunit|nr:ABC transporter permease [Treponema sp.]
MTPPQLKKVRFKLTFNISLFIILIALFLLISLANSVFLYPDYLIGVVLRNIVEIGILAFPMTLIIITGGIDFSIGSTMILCAMMSSFAASAWGNSIGLVAALVIGIACGLFNALLIVRVKLAPMVATLATNYLYLGIAHAVSEGESVYSFPASTWLGTAEMARFPLQIVFFMVLALVFVFVLDRTTLGRKLFAIGLNENSARYSGIDTGRVKVLIYLISGVLCAFAGLIWLGRFSSIKYNAGATIPLKVVTIVVLGGTSIMGGTGDMRGTILGALIVAVLNSGLVVLGIPIAVQNIVHGFVLMLSLICYFYINRNITKKQQLFKAPT